MAVAIWTFYDYVSPSGRNKIEDWRDDLSEREKAFVDVLIKNYSRMSDLTNDCRQLAGTHSGLIEFKFKMSDRQVRLVWEYGPNSKEITILMGCYHKQRRYTPTDALDQCLRRRRDLQTGIASRATRE